jgi:hypothetical protein
MLAPAALSEESKANAAPCREAFDSPLGLAVARTAIRMTPINPSNTAHAFHRVIRSPKKIVANTITAKGWILPSTEATAVLVNFGLRNMEPKVNVVAVSPSGRTHMTSRFGSQRLCLISAAATSIANPAISVLRAANFSGGLNANPALIAGKQTATPAVTTLMRSARTIEGGTRPTCSSTWKGTFIHETSVATGALDVRTMNPKCPV